MRYRSILFIVIISQLWACNLEPKEINYGKDQCNFCNMKIEDDQHSAEVITKKGKVFKYDAIECMMRDYNEAHNKVAMFFVNDYDSAKTLVNAKETTFLISKNLPSPMGEFLTGFSDSSSAKKMLEEKGGKLYSWDELTSYFENMQSHDE
ncbi:MAG: nitrous oxide reductase accessory protein NosL [Bacteroidota bacterium]